METEKKIIGRGKEVWQATVAQTGIFVGPATCNDQQEATEYSIEFKRLDPHGVTLVASTSTPWGKITDDQLLYLLNELAEPR